jgi:1,2-diacylglycerol 3-alpha-glucosyltransferase
MKPLVMRIGMVSDDFLPAVTGAGVHTQILSAKLGERGHTVIVITTRRPGQPPFEIKQGVRIYRTFSFPAGPFYISLARSGTLQKILEQEQIQILHIQYASLLALCSARAARKAELGVKQVYTYNMDPELLTVTVPLLKWLAPGIRTLAKRFYNQCDAITFPARRLLQEAQAKGISTRTVYISSATGIETSNVPLIEGKKKGFVILFVGRLSPEKNIAGLIRAFAFFKQKAPDAELWIVGEGPSKKHLIHEADVLGISAHVKFLGTIPHSEIGSYYARAHLFILPSWTETQGMVAIEAMYYSLPILVSGQIVSAQDLVEDGQNGFLINPASASDMASKMGRIYESPNLARAMGLKSESRSRDFRTEHVITAYEKLYTEILTEPSAGLATPKSFASMSHNQSV